MIPAACVRWFFLNRRVNSRPLIAPVMRTSITTMSGGRLVAI
jgi:hypothetical protein